MRAEERHDYVELQDDKVSVFVDRGELGEASSLLLQELRLDGTS